MNHEDRMTVTMRSLYALLTEIDAQRETLTRCIQVLTDTFPPDCGEADPAGADPDAELKTTIRAAMAEVRATRWKGATRRAEPGGPYDLSGLEVNFDYCTTRVDKVERIGAAANRAGKVLRPQEVAQYLIEHCEPNLDLRAARSRVSACLYNRPRRFRQVGYGAFKYQEGEGTYYES